MTDRPPSEKSLLNASLVEVTAVPFTLAWRNNTGQAWQGKGGRVKPGIVIVTEPGMVVLRAASPINYGLVGSGDILGVTAGLAWSIEMKAEMGRQSEQQRAFEAAWGRAGGRYVVSRSPADSRAFVEAIRRGEG